jgi:hypothetical protein
MGLMDTLGGVALKEHLDLTLKRESVDLQEWKII